MLELVEGVGEFVWGPLTILLLVGTGLYLTVRLRFIQLFRLWLSLRIVSGRDAETSRAGELSHFSALTVALSAAIGNGNIAGVATAIALGGPGAIFWMWVTAVVGMATVFASTTLALVYRTYDPKTGYAGGPMYYIERGLGPRWKPMARFFAFCAILAAFGTGNMVEANSVADTLEFSLRDVLAYAPDEANVLGVKLGIGVVYAVLIWLVIVGGIRRIGKVVSRLVPLMFVVYVGSALVVLGIHVDRIPGALALILGDAFTGTAATGGFAGAAVMTTIQFGVARGVFSNEAGLGTTPMAMAATRSDEPVRAGLVAMNGPLFDTLVVCTITALVIITTGVWTTGVSGSELTTMAFNAAVPDLGKLAVTLSLLFFSFSSVVGWSVYGERGTGYLFGSERITLYRNLFCCLLPVGAVMDLELIWGLCDIANGLMAIPNLIAIVLLSPLVVRLTREYFRTRSLSVSQD
ncbi:MULTISPECIES: alanine/glycine:cation symporter family protein [Marinobacter]|uniref:Sodium:alanine symporter family protein n=1 Tax=Marinobacter suaedae TaxID=3057675 RepID=A0ABT8VZT2_9GAMM|nr:MULTISPECIES: sodium:alanine symporter family protein [unclassified Marinobacter]MBZ2169652.1 sodium:alanine symporter family protein [Marinobacter sp. F4216]MDO3721485.1 sodium:alanine symporter family protein [Marinobacter sp. chi1]